MRKLKMVLQLERVAAADAPGRGGPLANAIERENGGLLERARKECAGGVTLVMIHEEERCARLRRKAAADHSAHHEFLAQPDWHRHHEAADSTGRERQLSLEQPLELQQRFVVKGDEIELVRGEPRLFQAIGRSMFRKSRIVLLTRETFLLRCRN